MSPTFLDHVRFETDNLELLSQGTMEPLGDIEECDHVVGEADPSIRKLYVLAMQWDKTAMEAIVAARYTNDNSAREQKARDAVRLRKKSEVLMDIFWISLKDAYDLWERPSIGIRRGWKVVWTESDPTPSLGDIFGGIFGR